MKTSIRVVISGSVIALVLLLAGCCCHSHKDVVTCGTGTHETVGPDGEISCAPDVECGEGTYEQGTGTKRECVPNLSCGEGTHEQGTGTKRECAPDLTCGEGTMEQGTGTKRECVPQDDTGTE